MDGRSVVERKSWNVGGVAGRPGGPGGWAWFAENVKVAWLGSGQTATAGRCTVVIVGGNGACGRVVAP